MRAGHISAVLLPLLAAAAPANGEDVAVTKRQGCVVNSSQIDLWVEDGLSRWRVAFSSEGTRTEDYCDIWNNINNIGNGACGQSFFNTQCYHNEVVGSWVVDTGTFRGPAGDGTFHRCHALALERWQDNTGCGTG